MSTVPIITNTSSIELDSSTEKEPTSPIPSTSPIVPITVQLPSGAVERSPQGNYVKFNEILGTGSFKTVYRGQNTNAGSLIAWNEVLLKRYGQRERKRIMNEVTMLRTLSHPNLISFYGAFVKKDNKEDEKVVFITELMSSGTLKDFCNKYPIPLKQIKRYCREVLECLHYLHTPQAAAAAAAVSNQIAVTGSTTGSTSTTSTSGTTSNVTGTTLGKKSVIHRDLKCDNIFMSTSGKGIKIGDLGLATTDGKSVMGTPEFMAPEMYESGYSTSVDIYAFGLCLLEMVTGKTPYIECTTVIQIYKNVLAGILPENTRVLEHGWPEAYRFLLRCLLPTNLSPSHSQQQQQQQQQLAATSSSTNTTLLGSNKHSTTTSSSSSLSSITGVAGTQSFEGGVGNVNDGSSGTGSGSKGNVLLRSPSTSSLSSISLLSPTAIATSSSTSSSSSSSSTSNIIISSSSIVRTSSSSSSSATSSASASSSTTPTSSSTFSAVAVTSIGSPFLSSGNNNLTTDGTRINGRSQGSSGSSGSSGSGRSAESVILTTDNIPSVTTSSSSQNNQLSNANAPNTNQPAQQSLQSLPPPLPTTKASSKSRRLMRPSAAELLLDPFLQPDSTEDGNRTTRDVRELAKEKGYSVITSSTDKNRRSDLSPITLVIALQHQQRLEKELQLRLQTEREEESKRTLQELELKKQQEEALLEEQQRQQKRQEEEEKEEGKKQRQALEQQQEESHYLLEKQRIDEEEAKRVQQQHQHQQQQILRPDDASIVMLLKSQLNTLQQTQQQVLLQTQQAQLQQQAHTEYIQQQSRLLIKSMENEVSQSALLSQLVHAQSAQIQTLLSSQQRTFEEIASIKNSAESSRAIVEWIAKNIRLSTSLSGGGSSNGSSTGGALTPNTSGGGGGGGGGHSSPSSNSPSSVLEHFQLPSSNSNTSGTLISNSGGGVSSPSPPSPSNSSSTPSSSLPSPSSQTNNNVLMSSHGTTINGISHAAFFSPSLPNGTSLLPLYSPPLVSSTTTTSSNTMMMNTTIDTASHEVARDIGSSTSSSTSSSTTTSSIGGKKLKTKSVSFATENSSSIGIEKEQAPSSSLSSLSGMGLSSSLNDSTHEDGIFSSNTTGNYSLSYLNRHGIGTQNKISIEELSKVSDDDVFIDSSIIDIDELTGEQVIEEMQSHLHQLRLKQFMSEIRQARISAKQLTEIITAKSELSAEYEETIQLESVRHTEELLKMDKQRQELLEKVTPIRLKIAAAASAAVSSSATLSATTPSSSSSSSSSSLSSSAPVLSDSTSSTENTLVVDSTNDEKTLSMSTISSSQALSIDTFSQSQSTEVGGGGGNTMSSDTSVVSNAIDTFSMEITVRERHEEVLYSRRLDLLDQRQKDEVFRNSDVLKEAQESFEAKSRRLVQREKEIREAFTSRVEKGRSELLLQIQMVCNRDTHTLMSTSEDVSQMGGSSSSSLSSSSTNSTWTETTIIANNGVDIGSNSGTAGIDDGSVNE